MVRFVPIRGPGWRDLATARSWRNLLLGILCRYKLRANGPLRFGVNVMGGKALSSLASSNTKQSASPDSVRDSNFLFLVM
jgi:hypothetical protein